MACITGSRCPVALTRDAASRLAYVTQPGVNTTPSSRSSRTRGWASGGIFVGKGVASGRRWSRGVAFIVCFSPAAQMSPTAASRMVSRSASPARAGWSWARPGRRGRPDGVRLIILISVFANSDRWIESIGDRSRGCGSRRTARREKARGPATGFAPGSYPSSTARWPVSTPPICAQLVPRFWSAEGRRASDRAMLASDVRESGARRVAPKRGCRRAACGPKSMPPILRENSLPAAPLYGHLVFRGVEFEKNSGIDLEFVLIRRFEGNRG